MTDFQARSASALAEQPVAWPAWKVLEQKAQSLPHLRDLIANDATRSQWLCSSAEGISLDARHQALDSAVWAALLRLAHDAQWQAHRDAMWRGEAVNSSEGRPVLHVALRAPDGEHPWGADITRAILNERARMLEFATGVRAGHLKAADGAPYTDVIHIGIGGSDLGPRMAQDALAPWVSESLRVHYLSNPDAWAVWDTVRGLDARRTLVIVSSKTFTTQETLTNAASVFRWQTDSGLSDAEAWQQRVAITASANRAYQLGYAAERVFLFWDWVGGRYSLWSSLGLPLALAIGAEHFQELLAGGHAMDLHFRSASAESNLPLMLGLFGVWNRNLLQCPSIAIAAYAARLGRFVPFIQQMDMESNGKSVRPDGLAVPVGTGPVVWGGLGIDGQHAYFQLLHQGAHRVPIEFIGVREVDAPLPLAQEHQRVVLLNLQAQAQALALGRDAAHTRLALQAVHQANTPVSEALVAQRSFSGNIPNLTLWLDRLDPRHLGALIALYEHKVFVQSCIWGINAFDQWGVELGKTMAQALESAASKSVSKGGG